MRKRPSRQSDQRRRLPPTVGALLVGAAMTIVLLAAYQTGLLRRIDHWGYDTSFRALGGIDADPRILMVDIDDSTIQRVGRWPWDRRKLAGMIDALSDLGASFVVLDMTFATPQPVRAETPAWTLPEPGAAVDPKLLEMDTTGLLIFDDRELAAAVTRAGNVYAGFDFKLHPPAQPLEMPSSPQDSRPLPELINKAHSLLEVDFSREESELRQLVGWPADGERFPLTEVKAWLARQACARFFEIHPNGSFEAFRRQMLPRLAPDAMSPDVVELRLAYDTRLAERWWSYEQYPSSLKGRVGIGTYPRLPIPDLVRTLAGIGSVVTGPTWGDPVVRSLPLWALVGERLVPHLSLRVASGATRLPFSVGRPDRSRIETQSLAFSLPPASWVNKPSRWGPSATRLRTSWRTNWSIPIEPDGTTLVPWARSDGESGEPWKSTFRQLPADRLLELVDRLEAIETNTLWREAMLSKAVRWATQATPGTWDEYAASIRARNAARCAYRWETRAERRDELAWRVVELTDQVARREQAALALLEDGRIQCEEAREAFKREGRYGSIPQECLELAEFDAALTQQATREWEERQARLRREADELCDQLRGEVDGSLCLVGLTASAVADFVPTPIDDHCPGVAVHAHMLNGLLSHQFVEKMDPRVQLALLALLGQIAAFAAAWMRMRRGLVVLLLTGVLLVAVCAVLFRRDLTVISWAPGLLMLAGVWVAVIAYRQATEARQRRQVVKVLAQYTSPAVAAGIAERVDDRGFAPQRRIITCFFSDLGDFTAAAERLDPEETRRLLQPYLERVSSALIAEQALVNKFIGDGVFAFFNAPLLPCTQQADRACRAALACLRASASSNGSAPPVAPLPVRIGMATGEAIVGDFGTERKRDYTAIGDAVNVASRLEAANKALGTRILVDEALRREASGFLFRSVGLLRVPGRAAPVRAHELLRPAGDPGGDVDGIESFEGALSAFASRDWRLARELLERCLDRHADDGVVRTYLRWVEAFSKDAPPDDWVGEVRILEK